MCRVGHLYTEQYATPPTAEDTEDLYPSPVPGFTGDS